MGKSKDFRDNQILGITYENGKRVLHLKLGVKKLEYQKEYYDDCYQLNQALINYDKWLKVMDYMGYSNRLADNNEDYN